MHVCVAIVVVTITSILIFSPESGTALCALVTLLPFLVISNIGSICHHHQQIAIFDGISILLAAIMRKFENKLFRVGAAWLLVALQLCRA